MLAKKAAINNMPRKISQARSSVPWVVQLWTGEEPEGSKQAWRRAKKGGAIPSSKHTTSNEEAKSDDVRKRPASVLEQSERDDQSGQDPIKVVDEAGEADHLSQAWHDELHADLPPAPCTPSGPLCFIPGVALEMTVYINSTTRSNHCHQELSTRVEQEPPVTSTGDRQLQQ